MRKKSIIFVHRVLKAELDSSKKYKQELISDLKTKTTELSQAKLSEGELQIQLNKNKSNYDLVQAKLESILQNYQAYKLDSGNYQIVKSAMKTVLEKDNRLAGLKNKDVFSGLSEIEVCGLIKNVIIESFDAKVSHYHSMNKACEKLAKNKTELLAKENAFENLSQDLTIQTKIVENHMKTIEDLKKIEELSQRTISEQKLELQQLELKCSESNDVGTNLRAELVELEKMFSVSEEENAKIKVEYEKSKLQNSKFQSALRESKDLLLAFEKKYIENKNVCEESESIKLELTLEIDALKQKVVLLQESNAKNQEQEGMYKDKANLFKSELLDLDRLYYILKETCLTQEREIAEYKSKLSQDEKVLSQHKQAITLKEEIISDLENEKKSMQNIHKQSK